MPGYFRIKNVEETLRISNEILKSQKLDRGIGYSKDFNLLH